ncbi:MAG: TIGR02466 family protein [Steroidobacteraceae bacterium]
MYSAPLRKRGAAPFNRRLLQECRQLRLDDRAGRAWSAANYSGGYTSYGSQHRLYEISPTFETLRKLLLPHVATFARSVEWDLRGRKLAMTDCWVNIMPHQVVHSLHLHPLSSLSGTYYVQVPPGSPGIKFEDPRLDKFMAAPPRKHACTRKNRQWVTLAATPGQVVLFESWLRHEVTPNTRRQERVSISFNFNWF